MALFESLWDAIPLAVRGLAALIMLVGAAIGLLAAINKYKTEKKRNILLSNELSQRFVSQFNKAELASFLHGYIAPKCSPSDPTNRDGEEYLADVRESLFDFIDRNILNTLKSYHLLLADTGMGKTTFCLNYLAYARKKFPQFDFALVSLASKSVESHIRNIANKSGTILLADALDEDPHGWNRGRDRLSEILELAEDFKVVIITCRSQYFISDDAIPRETPLAVLVPRQLGQSQTFALVRSYISPFSPEEISKYIDTHFPRLYFWRWKNRRKAIELVRTVPDLAYRPMLLERLPELAKTNASSHEIFDLYDLLVEGWLERESRWIIAERLRSISIELAIELFRDFDSRRGRILPEEIRKIAVSTIGESPDWNHLTSRSLLNRDSRGRYKFAHKSILEFLVVKAACQGSDRAFEVAWTDFMKEIFISWGHSDSGKGNWERAQSMLKSENGRLNIAPFYDALDTSPVMGIPDFQRCAERRKTSTGQRIAPATWRSSSIDFLDHGGQGVVMILDAEYNLSWTYFPRQVAGMEGLPNRLLDCLQFASWNDNYKLPSYEQFVSLVEGLYRKKSSVLPRGSLFLLGDRPARHEHLLVQIDGDVLNNSALMPIDIRRRVKGTSHYLTCYEAGMKVSASYAIDLNVEQLFLGNSGDSILISPLPTLSRSGPSTSSG